MLLGSASLDLVSGVSDSLAGRVQFLPVAGFGLEEVSGEPGSFVVARWLSAGLSGDIGVGLRALAGRFSADFLERDIPALGSRVSPVALERFWQMLAHYHGQVWNAAALARSMDVTAKVRECLMTIVSDRRAATPDRSAARTAHPYC